VQRGDEATKINSNRSLTNLKHGKDGLSKEKYLGVEMKESRRNKVYTYQSEESEDEDETTQEVWVPPTIIENKSTITDKINEPPSKQNDRFIPLRKSQNNLAMYRSEPDTLEKGLMDPSRPERQILREKQTEEGTSINQLQSKFEARQTKRTLEVETVGTGKFSEISAYNREMQLNSRIHHNIKEIEKTRKESTEPKPLIPPRSDVLSNLREQSMKRDRQETCGNVPFLRENEQHSNAGNGGMIFNNVPVKSGEVTFSHKPMTNSENLHVNSFNTTPYSSQPYTHTTSSEQTTDHETVTPSLRSHLGFKNMFPLQETDTQQKPISRLGYPMQVKSTAIPTHVSTYPTGQLSKPTDIPTNVSLYPTVQLPKPTALPTHVSTYPTGQLSKPTSIPTDVSLYPTGQLSKPTSAKPTVISTYPTGQLSKPTTIPTDVSKYLTGQLSKPTNISTYPTGQLSKPTTTPTVVSKYPTDQLSKPTSANPTVISTYPTGQLSKPTTTPTDVSTYPTGQLPNPTPRYIYPKRNISSTETQGYTPVYQPTVPISLVYPTSNVLFPAEQSHVNFMSNVAPVPNYTQPQMVMDLQPSLLDPRYSSSDASFPMPLVYPVDETTTVKNKQSVHTRDIIDTNTKVQKTKVSRKDRFMTAATTSDENNESPKFSLADNSVAATKAQRITYDRKVLLRLQKSVFSQRRPDNIDHIPEIQVVSTLDEMPVTYHSFTLTPGYVKRAARETQPTPATDKPAVRSKPKPKRTQSPAAAAPPGAVSAQPQITTEEIMRKAIGAINMVKHGCDASIVVKVISDLPINTEDALSRIVNLVVDTAVDDASCLSVCTSLCRVLARAKVQSRNDPGECVTFSMAYRQKCTKEIEQGILSRSTESHNRRIEEIARFTGSIARLILLKTCDIHAILMKFAQTQSEKCLECFCTLLTEVWERMEKCTSANYLDQYFEVIDEVLLYSETNAALKYKLGQLKSRQR
ncbi:translation initiation factor 4G, partial [Mytilus galloprovincialis]